MRFTNLKDVQEALALWSKSGLARVADLPADVKPVRMLFDPCRINQFIDPDTTTKTEGKNE
jgi:hypothetical protein